MGLYTFLHRDNSSCFSCDELPFYRKFTDIWYFPHPSVNCVRIDNMFVLSVLTI